MPHAVLGAGGTAQKGLAWVLAEREFWIYSRSSRGSFCGDIKGAMKLSQNHGHGAIPQLAEARGGLEGFPSGSLGRCHSCFTNEETEARSHTPLSASPASEWPSDRELTFIRRNPASPRGK